MKQWEHGKGDCWELREESGAKPRGEVLTNFQTQGTETTLKTKPGGLMGKLEETVSADEIKGPK